jgi:hypothetical protein
VPTPTTSTGSGGLSSGEEIGLFAVVGLVLAGIARMIVTDARGRAPTRVAGEIDRVKGSVRPLDHRIRDSRAKGKRAKRARRAGR